MKSGCHAVYELGADHRFANCSVCAPLRPILKEVIDHDGQIVIRRKESSAWGDDAMTIMIGIAGKAEVDGDVAHQANTVGIVAE